MPLDSQWGTEPYYYDEALALFAAMTSPPGHARKSAINTLIDSLKKASVWTKLDLLYVPAAHDSQAQLLNWKSPGNFTLTTNGTLTFAVDNGSSGDGSTGYLDTTWDPATNGSQYTQNGAHLGVYVLIDGAAGGGTDIGRVAASVPNTISAKDGSGLFFARINSTLGNIGPAAATAVGHSVVVRTSSTAVEGFKDGVSQATASITSQALDTNDIVLHRSGAVFGSDQIAAMHLGASLTGTNVTDIYNALHVYLQTVAGIA